jgi:hypothetical protein
LLFRLHGVGKAVATGCATKPRTAKQEATDWLSQSPRVIAISVDREMPTAIIRTTDNHVGMRVLKGTAGAAGGAFMAIVYGCGAGLATGPLFFVFCPLGIIASPFAALAGAGAGATGVKSVHASHPVEAAPGSSALFDLSAQDIDPAALLTEAIFLQADKTGHIFRPATADGSNKSVAGNSANLQLRFIAFELSGDIGPDARVSLLVTTRADLQTPTGETRLDDFTYEGKGRAVSEWNANEGRLFREEIRLAVGAAAAHILESLR